MSTCHVELIKVSGIMSTCFGWASKNVIWTSAQKCPLDECRNMSFWQAPKTSFGWAPKMTFGWAPKNIFWPARTAQFCTHSTYQSVPVASGKKKNGGLTDGNHHWQRTNYGWTMDGGMMDKWSKFKVARRGQSIDCGLIHFYKLYFVGIQTEAHEMIFEILFLWVKTGCSK